jgi:hypothetical protein
VTVTAGDHLEAIGSGIPNTLRTVMNGSAHSPQIRNRGLRRGSLLRAATSAAYPS